MEQIARLLYRENSSEPWGFRLSGGKDQGQPLQISQVEKMEKGEKWKMKNWDCSIFHSLKVVKDSLTQKAGLLPNDFLISVAGVEVYEMTHDQVTFNEAKISRQYIWWRGKKSDKSCFQAERSIQKAGDRFTMVIERWVIVSKDGKSWKGKGFPMNCPWHALPDYM